MPELIPRNPKPRIPLKQQGGGLKFLEDSANEQYTAKRDATRMPAIKQPANLARNFLTGEPVKPDDIKQGVAGTPQVLNSKDLQRPQGTISTPEQLSLRQKVVSTMNKVDRYGDDAVASIITAPVKSAMNLLRPDRYFKGVQSDSDAKGALGSMLGDVATALPITEEIGLARKGLRGVISAADSQISPVGRALEDVAIRGRAAGLTDSEVAANQLDKVGITSNQRKGYIPGVSDFLQKKITPFGYPDNLKEIVERVKEGNNLNSIEGDLKSGVLDSSDKAYDTSLRRNDAWRVYLGMPQKNNTFRMAEEFEPGWATKPTEDRYALNYDHEPNFIRSMHSSRPGANTSWDLNNSYPLNNSLDASHIQQPSIGGDMGVMGNHGIKERSNGLEYWDRWDLDPEIDIPFTRERQVQQDDWADGIFTAYQKPKMTIPVSKFIGKPFISNGITTDEQIGDVLNSNTNSEYKKRMNSAAKSMIQQFLQNNPPKP